MKLTEKQKNCPYCQSEDPDDNLAICGQSGDGRVAIGSTGDLEVDEGSWIMEENFYEYQDNLFEGSWIMEENFYEYQDNLLKYCPMCGRPLNEEEE